MLNQETVGTFEKGALKVLGTKEEQQWMDVLKASRQHDFFHLPGYHRMAELRGEGEGLLFVYEEGPYTIALPLLLRPLSQVEWLGESGHGWYDATSVYGYVGPVYSHTPMPGDICRRFQSGLENALKQRSVIAAFSILHPLIAQKEVFAGMGQVREVGQTVWIDLQLPEDQQVAKYRTDHRNGVNRFYRRGGYCQMGGKKERIPELVDIYRETMQRVDADSFFHFDAGYFETLLDCLQGHGQIVTVHMDGRVIGAGVFVECDGIIQYHLSGARTNALKLSPAKVMIDAVRRSGAERGCKWMHLGGGAGALDSLFEFKAGFSDKRGIVACWRHVVNPPAYEDFCQQAAEVWCKKGWKAVGSGYFPQYRTKLVAE